MKVKLLGIFAAALLFSTAKGECLSKVAASELLTRLNQTPTLAREVKELPQFNACMVKTESGDTFFISKDGKLVIEGILLKVPKVRLSKEDYERLKRRALFQVGEGEPILVITNPLCKACRKRLKKIFRLSRRFKLIFVPVGFEGEEFKAAVDAYCRKKGPENFFKEESNLKVCDYGKLKVWSSQAVLEKYGITATPVFIFKNGRAAVGVKEIEEALKSKSEREPF
ncbi:hypothetical protein [Thermovibrio sp.]